MTERAKSILYLFLFSYFLWGMFTIMLVMGALRDYENRIESEKTCFVKDQNNICYTAEHYQNYLKYKEYAEQMAKSGFREKYK